MLFFSNFSCLPYSTGIQLQTFNLRPKMEFWGFSTSIWSIILQLFLLISASSGLGGGQLDKLALLALKAEMNDTLGILSSWNESLPVCKWPGIHCSRKHLRVTVLDLQSSQLKGHLSYHIGNLSFLRVLNLQNNSFSQIIPKEIGSLSKLQVLNLGKNNLIGEIPACFGNLSFLNMFSVEQNNLVGAIPSSIGKLKSLTFLALGTNNLTGTLPPSIYNLSSIKHISLLDNQLDGTLPFGLGLSIFPQLEIFHFHMNQFSGEIPITISNATHLSEFGISQNHFTGKVPSMARMTNLSRVEMDDNNLGYGDNDLGFVSSLVNSTKLELLGFNGNKFQGVLPESIGNLSKKLKAIRLGRNQIRGSIPIGIGNLINLGILGLDINLLTGPVPSSIGKLHKLYNLFLNHNQLSGKLKNLVALDVSENKLSGSIPSDIRSCKSLETLHLEGNLLEGMLLGWLLEVRGLEDIDVSRNNLSGTIPDAFGNLPFLRNLNLSFNDFDGAVPLDGVFQNTSAFSIMGNARLCGGIPTLRLPRCNSTESIPRVKIITSIACSGVIVIIVLCFLLIHPLRKGKVKSTPRSCSLGVSQLKVSYGDLLKATNGFSPRNLIGRGRFGSVYRGILHQEERIVAVKVLNLQSSRGSFIAECEILKSIRHRNIVKLITACASIDFKGNDFKALVYQFMMNGSLEEWLHSSADRLPGAPFVQGYLNLIQRVNIAIDIATALDYMHNFFHKPIVHCDLKPRNILLDNDMNACVGDFGLARYLTNPLHAHENSSNAIMGSIGYIAPEYGMGSPVSTYGDVYSYGILLLEMFTGKRPTADMFTDGLNLHKYVRMTLPECVKEIYDPVLLQSKEHSTIINARMSNRNHIQNDQRQRVEKCLVSIARIGVACSVDLPKARMEIGKVIDELHLIRDVLTGTKMPGEHMITT
ncbi:putative receptor-like protein kinase At3g47110 isoform X2 [Rosa chinensis]|uniref:putative receptor-like protein kinase At3g47110 isoform X2 n=1 Tax=Rosa chinensis TaxID=74649 RepID=UPI001AD9079A|nr:putative receptor-like protein kinase At3g47110 isoform X2 [Rosa chinensis]